MKTLSNAELQDAIEHTVRLIRGDGSRSSVILTVHLEALTDEQRRRATDELTLEPMTTTLERAEFDARVEAQDGPEWVEWGGGECPAKDDDVVDVELRNGKIHIGIKAEDVHWPHSDLFPHTDLVRYRNWTAWEQSK